MNVDLGTSFAFLFRQIDQKYIYAKCRECKAKIAYKKKDGDEIFEITQFRNHHTHVDSRGIHRNLKN